MLLLSGASLALGTNLNEVPMEVTLNELEQHLWGAANSLRGGIDSGESEGLVMNND